MFIRQLKSFAVTSIVTLLLATACSKNDDSQAVAHQFVRLYFVENNLAGAAELASGATRERIEELLREMEAMGGTESPAEKPPVKVTLMGSQTDAQDEKLYIYQVTPEVEVEGMEPVTVRLWLRKEGNTWFVSKFVQEE